MSRFRPVQRCGNCRFYGADREESFNIHRANCVVDPPRGQIETLILLGPDDHGGVELRGESTSFDVLAVFQSGARLVVAYSEAEQPHPIVDPDDRCRRWQRAEADQREESDT